MKYSAESVDDYVRQLPDDKRPAVEKLRRSISKSLPKGFEETLSYGMIGYVVPHSKYAAGYHCDPALPLPFINLAAQKNFIALYHMGIYSNDMLMSWFVSEYPKYSTSKLDMGKSCIRFKKPEDIPYELIEKLCSKVTVDQWIQTYESVLNSSKNRKTTKS